MTEWKAIEGHEGYEISVEGVRSYWNTRHRLQETPKMLKFSMTEVGYYCFNIERKPRYFHRLLMIAFVPNPDNKPCIDHINRIRTDNRIENLRWATHQENQENKSIQSNNKLGIQHIFKDRNGFQFRITRNKIEHRKYFNTLEEAIAYKDEYLKLE